MVTSKKNTEFTAARSARCARAVAALVLLGSVVGCDNHSSTSNPPPGPAMAGPRPLPYRNFMPGMPGVRPHLPGLRLPPSLIRPMVVTSDAAAPVIATSDAAAP